MDDPAGEIEKVAVLLMAAVNPEIQKAAVLKYYTPDVSFRHPFCTVPSAPNSREALLAILQWYRVLSPKLVVHMRSATFDRDTNDLYLDAEQDFHIRWSPFRAAPSRFLIHLKLRPTQEPSEGTTLYQIASQEDFYHPEDLAALLMPRSCPSSTSSFAPARSSAG
ncbi:hypothetical protein A0H81_06866 [Grifola frondosa]|uniref:SigF-like NTF2-like domain-containing protein n=1 Tax=Grifola frondosa TaxID=5627 RepID=A0A1C7M7K1_GRIFR|nr:hypothetical protein A0H81_06866 [Grifola frondosa]